MIKMIQGFYSQNPKSIHLYLIIPFLMTGLWGREGEGGIAFHMDWKDLTQITEHIH